MRRSRAVSEIVAALMLILIVTSAGVLIAYHVTNRISTSASQLDVDMDALERRMRDEESLAILYAYYNTSDSTLHIYVSTGAYPVTVSAIYVEGRLVWNNTITINPYSVTDIPGPGKNSIPLSLGSGDTFEVKVSTINGVVKAAQGYAA